MQHGPQPNVAVSGAHRLQAIDLIYRACDSGHIYFVNDATYRQGIELVARALATGRCVGLYRSKWSVQVRWARWPRAH